MDYCLMNKDRQLLLFRVMYDEVSGETLCEEVERYAEPKFFPPDFTDIDYWVNRRNYAKHKEHLQRWLKEWQLDHIDGFLEMTHALSLNDSLWVRPVDSSLQWEQVNLYRNEFTDVISRTAFEKGLHGLKLSSTSPEFTSEGSFEKCWMREEDGVHLYKKGSEGFGNAGLEPWSEFYSSQYAAAICRDSVRYELVKFKGAMVSRCRMFTTEDEGFVPIYKYLNERKQYHLQDILRVLDAYGFADAFRDMIVLDAIIFNPDRHFGNFGFIVDNTTWEIKRFAPVFDHNMAMLARIRTEDLAMDAPRIREMGHKIGPAFVPGARWALTDRTRDILRALLEEPLLLQGQYDLPKERTDFLERAVHRQIKEILSEKGERS